MAVAADAEVVQLGFIISNKELIVDMNCWCITFLLLSEMLT